MISCFDQSLHRGCWSLYFVWCIISLRPCAGGEMSIDSETSSHVCLLQTSTLLTQLQRSPSSNGFAVQLSEQRSSEHGGDDKALRSITLPRHAHTHTVSSAAAIAKRSHAVALFEGDGFTCWGIVFIVFGILAWCSILYEAWLINQTDKMVDRDKDMLSREPLWDIAKLFLMILVWCFHDGKLGTELYRGWFMPAFFFLSGLVTTPVKMDCSWIRKVTVSVLRDNVFNCILLKLLIDLVRRKISWEWTAAWFLHALCICRIGIPLCFGLTRCVGEIGGSILLVAVAFTLPYMLYGSVVIRLNTEACLPNSCNKYVWRIMCGWISYSLGFLTDPRWLARQIKIPAAAITSAVLVVIFLWGRIHCGFVWLSVWYDTEAGSWQEYVHDTLVKQLCIVLFLAGLAPVACIGRVIPQVLAKLGQRTLQAYLINVFLLYIGMAEFTPTFEDPHSPRAVGISHAVVTLTTFAACSPLSEWCFQWVTSPQWIFDAGSKATSMLQIS